MSFNHNLPSVDINKLEKLKLEYLVIYDERYCEVFEVHFLGKSQMNRNICWHYNPAIDQLVSKGDFEQQTFKWIIDNIEEGRFLVLEGDLEEISNQLYLKDVQESLKNKWAPRPI